MLLSISMSLGPCAPGSFVAFADTAGVSSEVETNAGEAGTDTEEAGIDTEEEAGSQEDAEVSEEKSEEASGDSVSAGDSAGEETSNDDAGEVPEDKEKDQGTLNQETSNQGTSDQGASDLGVEQPDTGESDGEGEEAGNSEGGDGAGSEDGSVGAWDETGAEEGTKEDPAGTEEADAASETVASEAETEAAAETETEAAAENDETEAEEEVKNSEDRHVMQTEVDETIISVIYDDGVFPEKVTLEVRKVDEDSAEQEEIREKVEKALNEKEPAETEQEESGVCLSVFEIHVLDENREEIEPDTQKGEVFVRFEGISVPGWEDAVPGADDITVFGLENTAADKVKELEKVEDPKTADLSMTAEGAVLDDVSGEKRTEPFEDSKDDETAVTVRIRDCGWVVLAVRGQDATLSRGEMLEAGGTIVKSGICGDRLTWKLDDNGLLTISGTGEMDNYESWSSSQPWAGSLQEMYSIKAVSIESGVTSIGTSAFEGGSYITSVMLPESLKKIGAYAFNGCLDITAVQIPHGVTEIGERAFQDCRSLTDVTLPDSVTSLEGSVFSGCSGLVSVKIPDGMTDMGDAIFNGCSSLKNVTIPDSVTVIGDRAFRYCSSLESVKIGSGVRTIEQYAFWGCSSLANITIPDGVKIIENDVFRDCSNLTDISVPDSVTRIGLRAFLNCGSLTGIIIPNGVTVIENDIFHGCTSLKSMTIPGRVTKIENSAFENCQGLVSVTIPGSVTEIGARAFSGCSNLAHVYFIGSSSQWNRVVVGDNNDPLKNAAFHYSIPDEPAIPYYDSNGEVQTLLISDVLGGVSLENYILSASSTEYDPKLAHILAAFSNSAYAFQNNLTNSFIEGAFYGLGIQKEDIKEDFRDQLYSGYAIAKKILPNGSTLAFVVIRGSNGWNWASNFLCSMNTLNSEGKHTMFQEEADLLYSELSALLGGIPKSNIRYVITGHSQGAAVANLLSLKLSDAGVPKEYVFDYNFACPDVARKFSADWNPFGIHDNMFNIADARDPVSYIPGIAGNKLTMTGRQNPLFSWGKFGRSYWFSYNWYESSKVHINFSLGNDSPHMPDNYVKFMAKHKNVSEFKSWNDTTMAQLSLAAYNFVSSLCPVDLYVYDSAGKLMASVIDNKENYYDSDFGDVLIFIDGDSKSICFKEDSRYEVKLAATDNGEMLYEAGKFNLGAQEMDVKTFENVRLETGREMQSEVQADSEVSDIKLFVVDEETAVAEVLTDGTEIEVQPSDPVEVFIRRLYTTCLSREADAGGLEYWKGRINSGSLKGIGLASEFVFSKEFKSKNYCNEHFVKQIYPALMGREPDAGGLAYWVGQLDSGRMNRESLLNSFTSSAEYKNLCTEAGIELGATMKVPEYGVLPYGPCAVCGNETKVVQFAERMYTVCLGRAAETGGLAYWSKGLYEQTITGKSILENFFLSSEIQGKNLTNREYVRRIYKAMLDRDPDGSGWDYWEGRLNSGASPTAVIAGFIDSNEFTGICDDYGIKRK